MNKMTLEQVRDNLRKMHAGIASNFYMGQMADAIDAHLAQQPDLAITEQARGERRSNHVVWRREEWLPCYCDAKADHQIGMEITATQQPDLAAIREVIASIDLRAETHLDPQCKTWADKLARAIGDKP